MANSIAKELMLHGKTASQRMLGRQLLRGGRPNATLKLALDTAEKLLQEAKAKTRTPEYIEETTEPVK